MPPSASSGLSLADWLARLEQLHPSAIDLGLERVRRVKDAMGLAPAFPIITVGGTNGKGSTCATLEAILGAAGYKTGLYTSPHLLRYNERVRIAGKEASDAELVAAFERIDAVRGDISLTYFEFGTLGAMAQFIDAGVDVAILEVGLGGRLDAVNVFDADAAIVSSVDLDHMDYLGDSREQIGFEKAGIYRSGRPAICADPDPPDRLLEHARHIGADLRCVERDFFALREDDHWTFRSADVTWPALPLPAMAGTYQLRNAAGALAALAALRGRLPVNEAAIRSGLARHGCQDGSSASPARPMSFSMWRITRKRHARWPPPCARSRWPGAPWRWSGCWPTRTRRGCVPPCRMRLTRGGPARPTRRARAMPLRWPPSCVRRWAAHPSACSRM